MIASLIKLLIITFLFTLEIGCGGEMKKNTSNQHLKHFQNHGDQKSLMTFVEGLKENTQAYQEVIKIMSPIFEAFSLTIGFPLSLTLRRLIKKLYEKN